MRSQPPGTDATTVRSRARAALTDLKNAARPAPMTQEAGEQRPLLERNRDRYWVRTHFTTVWISSGLALISG